MIHKKVFLPLIILCYIDGLIRTMLSKITRLLNNLKIKYSLGEGYRMDKITLFKSTLCNLQRQSDKRL